MSGDKILVGKEIEPDEDKSLDEIQKKREIYYKEICSGKHGKPIDYLSQFFFPHLVGKEWKTIRKASLLLLLTHADSRTRMRLHMLLDGKPGTGKSEVLLWWQKHLQGILVNAELTSKTGLVGDARGNKVKAGLLSDYDGNFVCVDELDKMNLRDQNGLLQAMEEGKYIIVKGSHRQPFKAEVRVIASSNDIKKLQKPLIDRFDFIFKCKTSSREERAEQTQSIVNGFLGKNDENINDVKGYLKYVENFSPTILPEDNLPVVDTIRHYINKAKNVNIESVSYRQLELSILRVAWAMAKLERKHIKKEHVVEAIIIKDKILRTIHGVNK